MGRAAPLHDGGADSSQPRPCGPRSRKRGLPRPFPAKRGNRAAAAQRSRPPGHPDGHGAGWTSPAAHLLDREPCAVHDLPARAPEPRETGNTSSAFLKAVLSPNAAGGSAWSAPVWKPLPARSRPAAGAGWLCLPEEGSPRISSAWRRPPPATARLNALLDHLHPGPFDVPFSCFKIPFGGRSDSIKQNY